MSMFFVTVYSKQTQSLWILSCKHTHLFKLIFHLYFNKITSPPLQKKCMRGNVFQIYHSTFIKKINHSVSLLCDFNLVNLNRNKSNFIGKSFCYQCIDMTTPPWWREKVMVYYYYHWVIHPLLQGVVTWGDGRLKL